MYPSDLSKSEKLSLVIYELSPRKVKKVKKLPLEYLDVIHDIDFETKNPISGIALGKAGNLML
jgi:hypothetical protein